VRREFLDGVYGPAGRIIEKYQDLLAREVAERDVQIPCWLTPQSPLFTDGLTRQCEALFDQAETAVNAQPADLQLRVRQARMPIDYVVICRNANRAGTGCRLVGDRLETGVPADVSEACQRFFDTARKVGLNNLHEGEQGNTPAQVDELWQQVGMRLTGAAVQWIRTPQIELAVAPALGLPLVLARRPGQKPILQFSGYDARRGFVAAFDEALDGSSSPPDFGERPDADGWWQAIAKSQTIGRRYAADGDGFSVETRVSQAGGSHPAILAADRLLVALKDKVTISGAFGRRDLPGLVVGSPGEIVIPADGVNGQPVTVQSDNGAGIRIWPAGHLASLVAGPEPDGLVSLTLHYRTIGGTGANTPDWKTRVEILGSADNAGAAEPGTIEVPATAFTLYLAGDLSGCSYDPESASGSAASIVGSTNEWAIQWPYALTAFQPGKTYVMWAIVKVVSAAAGGGPVQGTGLTCGIWNSDDKASRADTSLTDAVIRPGEWQLVKVGSLAPKAGDYLWIAPARNPQVQKILVDRLLFSLVGP
jgi:hypothetical protein